MRENQDSIVAWTNETFGESPNVLRVAARANEEMAELLRAVTAGIGLAKIAEEAADVAIVLCRVTKRVGLTVDFAGPGCSNYGSLLRPALQANASLALVMLELDVPVNFQRIAILLDDVFMFLREVCVLCGTTLDAAIQAKMAINRGRTWNLDGSGQGYHVREAA